MDAREKDAFFQLLGARLSGLNRFLHIRARWSCNPFRQVRGKLQILPRALGRSYDFRPRTKGYTAMAPFPWYPMMAMAIGLTSHSFCLTNLFPYAGYMVRHMGVTDDKDAAGERSAFPAFLFPLKSRTHVFAAKQRPWRQSRLLVLGFKGGPDALVSGGGDSDQSPGQREPAGQKWTLFQVSELSTSLVLAIFRDQIRNRSPST